jgi:D-glycero-alpha-D-manno-heptose 1-phosphate guanylyltransferase
MIREAIILAGGMGTRLREAVPDLPKCMAPVASKPFLFYVINQLRSQGIERFIFSLGYRHEAIQEYLKNHFPTLSYTCVIEQEPLGTGGAILLAAGATEDRHVVVTNGDTLFKADLRQAFLFHVEKKSQCTLVLKPMMNTDRYGVVVTDHQKKIIAFHEKKYYDAACINGGLYILDLDYFRMNAIGQQFSFEKDFLEIHVGSQLYGIEQDSYFIDIGIPIDYQKAQDDLKMKDLDLLQIDKTWTLFIDRDGVINQQNEGGYIERWEDFHFLPGVKKAIKRLSNKFGRIFIISNQRGVGKGIMTESALLDIHQKMTEEIRNAGGRIDEIFFCTSIDNLHSCRKPNPGMAYQAKFAYPEIDFNKTIMVGNKMSDMYFAENAGIYAVFLATTNPEVPFPHSAIDARFDSLINFAQVF